MSLTIKKISSSDVCDCLTMESAAYGKYFAMIEWIVTDDSDDSDESYMSGCSLL